MNKAKYITKDYTPEIIKQNPDLPNIQRDAYNKITSRIETHLDVITLNRLRESIKRSMQPIF